MTRFERIRDPKEMQTLHRYATLRVPCLDCGSIATRVEEVVIENGEQVGVTPGYECQGCGEIKPG